MVGNQPVAKFRHGSVEAAIFENEVKKNGKSFTVRKVVVQISPHGTEERLFEAE